MAKVETQSHQGRSSSKWLRQVSLAGRTGLSHVRIKFVTVVNKTPTDTLAHPPEKILADWVDESQLLSDY